MSKVSDAPSVIVTPLETDVLVPTVNSVLSVVWHVPAVESKAGRS